ncbi:MAG: amidohydrolase family protein [Gemmatimonadetes bacterium]|nr:amidohydrolase family protein [Gemmatimonadota bacterium]
MPRHRSIVTALGVMAFVVAPLQGQEHFDLLITGGRVIDGTGNPWVYADIGVRDGKIVAVGQLAAATADRTLDVTGKVVTPGFIDLHSHAGGGRRSLSDDDPQNRSAPNMIAQGATTLVVNQDGRSPWPIREQRRAFQDKGTGPNTIMMVGHGTVRSMAMGDDFRRAATEDEVAEMQRLVRQAMDEGAYGMSAGHEYTPMIWSTTDEIVSLVSEIKPYGGFYIVHERSSGAEPMWWWPSQDEPGAPTMLDAVVETIEVAERTGVPSVQTHIKARGANFWGSSHALIQLIQRARDRGVNIWADAYSYNTTGSDGRTVLIPPWVRRLAQEESGQNQEPDYAATLRRLLQDPDSAAMIRMDVEHEMLRRGGAENILILDHPDRQFVGKTLRDLADARGISPVEMGLRLQLEGDPNQPGGARTRGFSLSEYDLASFFAQPWVASASDAGIAMPGDGFTHPRFYGNFPRKIRRFAIEQGVLSVESAIRSMTSLPAQILGLRDRGLIREGQWADIVVMDLETIRDKATALEPHQYPEGIEHVLVNGEFVIENATQTWALPGVVITPADKRGRPVME